MKCSHLPELLEELSHKREYRMILCCPPGQVDFKGRMEFLTQHGEDGFSN